MSSGIETKPDPPDPDSVVPLRRVEDSPSARAIEPRLLATKLFVPVTRAACVPRPRLLSLLERGTRGPLTLLSAPAGSGKTTLVANWLRGAEQPAAWLSLDERDNDLARFLRYLVAAIACRHDGFGEELFSEPKALSREDPLDLATDLVNEVASLGTRLVVVLDDVHVLDDPGVHEVLALLVDACPPNLHLVMTTRADPALPLSRMRARGLLTEVRAPELRFTQDETAAFFGDVMGVALTAEQVAQLESRTEGWAVGLQMAALSLQGREDAGAFIEGFAGSHRYVLDYLMDEVLRRLPEDSRTFLMQTSILRQLTGALVDAVTQRSDGVEMLDTLESRNVFTIPLDSRRTAYRYHHLFGTLLRHELEATASPEMLRGLHGRASRALEAQGQCEDAVDHALLAQQYDRASELLIPMVMSSTIRGESHALARLLARFPVSYADANPRIALLEAWLDYYSFKYSSASVRLQRLRACQRATTEPGLDAEIELLIGMVALEGGDLELGTQALLHVEALPADRPYLHAFKSMHRAVLAMMQDRLGDARDELDRTRHAVRKTGDPYAEMWVDWQCAHVDLLRGRLDLSRRAHDALLESAMNEFGGAPPSSALVGFGTGIYLALHQHDLARASELVAMAAGLGKGLDRRHGYVSCLLMPRAVFEVQSGRGGDWQGTIDQAVRHLDAMDSPMSVSRIEAQRIRLALHPRSGVDPKPYALGWVSVPGIRDGTHEVYRPNPMPGVQVDHPRFVLARCLAVLGEFDEALEVVEDCLGRSVSAQRRTCEVEGELLRAEIVALQGGSPDLQRAVERAAMVGSVGPFVEFERTVLPGAIEEAERQGARAFAAQLRAALRPETCPSPPHRIEPPVNLVEPNEELSDRELEVLGLIAVGMSNAEASRKLFIAPSTVKKHLEHIYGKLAVNRRTQAVARARALGLIAG